MKTIAPRLLFLLLPGMLFAYPPRGRTLESQALVSAALRGDYYLAKDILDNHGGEIDFRNDFNGGLIIGAITGLREFAGWNFVSRDAIALVHLFLDYGIETATWDVWSDFPLVWNPEIEALAENLHQRSPFSINSPFPRQMAQRSFRAAKWLRSKGLDVALPDKGTETVSAADDAHRTMGDGDLIEGLRGGGIRYCLSRDEIRRRIQDGTFAAADELYALYGSFSGKLWGAFSGSWDLRVDLACLLAQAGDRRVIPGLLEFSDNSLFQYLIRRLDPRVFQVITGYRREAYPRDARMDQFAALLAAYYADPGAVMDLCVNALDDGSFPMLLTVALEDEGFQAAFAAGPEWEAALRFGRGAARFNAVDVLAAWPAGQDLLRDYLFITTGAKLFLHIASRISLPAETAVYDRLIAAFDAWTKRQYSPDQIEVVQKILELLFVARYPDTPGVIRSHAYSTSYNSNVLTICDTVIGQVGREAALDIFAEHPPTVDRNRTYYRENYHVVF